MNKHKSNKIKENSNTVRHLIMGQIITTQNLVATKVVRLAGQWWRHQMETFSALLAICAGNSLVPGEFPAQRPVTRSFDVFFDLRLNKRLSKQSWGWWFETLSCPLWRHCNATGSVCFPLADQLFRRPIFRKHIRAHVKQVHHIAQTALSRGGPIWPIWNQAIHGSSCLRHPIIYEIFH